MVDATFAFYIDWDNDGSVDSLAFEANETVTTNVLGVRTPLQWKIGRDGDRSISGFLSGDVEIELNNSTRIYSPDNAASALFGNLGPGKPVRIRATSGTTRDIFRGFIDEYKVNPSRDRRSVTITAVDCFAHIADTVINTALFQGIPTGEALEEVLDAVGWPSGDRDIDQGCTTIRHWWLENVTAAEAINDILASEGPPAICYIDGSNNFVFKDRMHRLVDANTTTTQATFRDQTTEPIFSEPAEYNAGYKDIINSVSFDVAERIGVVEASVWSSDDVVVVPASSTIQLTVQADDPFSNAQVPDDDQGDYTLVKGSVTSISLSRTSGQSTVISITAGGSGATIENLLMRAVSYPVQVNYRVTVEDSTSITKYGRTSWAEEVPKWVGKNDAEAIAALIVLLRKERLPTFSLTLWNDNSTRLGHILDRTISDLVTIVEAETTVNHSHYIESIEYDVLETGKYHSAYYTCERTPTWVPDKDNIFILNSNVSGHRLDSGKLGY